MYHFFLSVIRHAHAIFAPLNFINKNIVGKRGKPNIPFRPTLNLEEYQICQQTVHKIAKFYSHFQLKSKREGRNNQFQQAISSEILEVLSVNKSKLNTAFDNGFYSEWK